MKIIPVYSGEIIKIISKPCYLIVYEKSIEFHPTIPISYAVSKSGDYIGDTKTAYRLVNKYGISVFEKRKDTSCVCSIGYSLAKRKWFGWSHRAIYGFKTKRQAIRFAESVS